MERNVLVLRFPGLAALKGEEYRKAVTRLAVEQYTAPDRLDLMDEFHGLAWGEGNTSTHRALERMLHHALISCPEADRAQVVLEEKIFRLSWDAVLRIAFLLEIGADRRPRSTPRTPSAKQTSVRSFVSSELRECAPLLAYLLRDPDRLREYHSPDLFDKLGLKGKAKCPGTLHDWDGIQDLALFVGDLLGVPQLRAWKITDARQRYLLQVLFDDDLVARLALRCREPGCGRLLEATSSCPEGHLSRVHSTQYWLFRRDRCRSGTARRCGGPHCLHVLEEARMQDPAHPGPSNRPKDVKKNKPGIIYPGLRDGDRCPRSCPEGVSRLEIAYWHPATAPQPVDDGRLSRWDPSIRPQLREWIEILEGHPEWSLLAIADLLGVDAISLRCVIPPGQPPASAVIRWLSTVGLASGFQDGETAP